MAEKFKIKKGDNVIVVTGRDKGKQGEVLEVLRAESRVRVQRSTWLRGIVVQLKRMLGHRFDGGVTPYFKCCPH